ncbi:hypothetical protein BURPS305_7712 [Burkholderia pseudomallei 305]|nr:hypothetical protein BMASAVP1_A2626 [Burkholderia mallei SAVP1]EBA50678.1 hypothetical protein BURPS305_7712 [Burkholderia pseudomallei 305]EDU08627.1 hypothetical protein BURPS1655_E0811 [Burkholderia pseudomallei 1655]EEP85205.1 conserved hypothetical protein [Burkholderia mallei GB8 horse 4]
MPQTHHSRTLLTLLFQYAHRNPFDKKYLVNPGGMRNIT